MATRKRTKGSGRRGGGSGELLTLVREIHANVQSLGGRVDRLESRLERRRIDALEVRTSALEAGKH